MFNLSNVGTPICKIIGDSKLNNKIVSLSEESDEYVSNFEEINLKGNDKFEIIPNKEEDRKVVYLSGPAGVGKSFLIAKYCKQYRHMYKDSPIYLISEKDDDKQLDTIKGLKRIKCDEDLISDPLDLKDFTEMGRTLTIFDDIDSFEPKLKRAVYTLLNKLLKVGRSYNISVLVSSHTSCDGRETKSMLNESNIIVFYPTCYNRSIKYLCENYVGMNKKDIEKMKKNKSRWCAYVKTYPSCIVQEQNIWRMGGE